MHELSIESKMRSRSAGLLAALAVTICTTGFAHAAHQKKESAAENAKEAAVQFNLGHLEEATTLFERAYEIDPDPILLFNIGQCHRQAGNDERALFFYQRYLDQAVQSASNRQEVEALVSDLERSVEEQTKRQKRPPAGIERAPEKTQAAGVGNPADDGAEAPDSAPVEGRADLSLHPSGVAQPHGTEGTTSLGARSEQHEPLPTTSHQPLARTWWFWTAIGVTVAAGVAAALILVSNRAQDPGCPAGSTCSNR
jgi:hypothetical protein